MEAAKPIKFFTPKENINEEKIDFIEELSIKQENKEYKILFGIKGNKNELVIKSFSESSKEIFYYQQSYSIYELQNLSKIFAVYETIKDILFFLKNLKFDVELENEELIIKFQAFMPDGQSKLIAFNLKKILMDTNHMIKYLLDEIKSVKENMNIEISNLKMKYDSEINKLTENNTNYKKEISNLKEENKKLWKEINDLKKLKEDSKINSKYGIKSFDSKITSIDSSDFLLL